MKKIILVLVFFLVITAIWGQGQNEDIPSAIMMGVFNKGENLVIKSAFINGVTHFLRNNGARIISHNDNYVEMSANYKYDLKIELKINDNNLTYEIIVSVAQERYARDRAKTTCNNVISGVHKSFTRQLAIAKRTLD